MRKWRYLTPAVALMLLTMSCKDKSKPAESHPNQVEEIETTIDTENYSEESGTVDSDPNVSDTSPTVESHSTNLKSSNQQKEEKFRGVESDLRDFSDTPESSKKETLREIARNQDELQTIAFNGKSDFKKAEGLARKISSLFASIGAKEESARWLQTAETYHKQSK